MKTTAQLASMTLALLFAASAAAQEPPADVASPAAEAPAQAPAAPPDMAAFTRGAKAWADNCSRCHRMRDPKELSDNQWKVSLTHMRLRAGLDGADVRDITVFLTGSN
jgi:mono/diheme cytochrome c family protein